MIFETSKVSTGKLFSNQPAKNELLVAFLFVVNPFDVLARQVSGLLTALPFRVYHGLKRLFNV